MKHVFTTTALVAGCLLVSSALAESPIRPGDHVALVGNTFADQLRRHGYLETLLLHHWPEDPVTVRNLGWGGDMLTKRDRPTGFPSEESTLTEHATDVIVACFGMGESFAGEAGLEAFRGDLRAFVESHRGKSYNGRSPVRLVLVSPIAYEDLGDVTPSPAERNRDLEAYTRAMAEVAADEEIPFVDLFERSRYLMDESAGPPLTTNGIHLGPYGYWAMSRSFYTQLVSGDRRPPRESWRVRIDVRGRTVDTRGVVVSDLATADANVSFTMEEKSPPSPPPPTVERLPPQLQPHRDTLVVEGLSGGTYRLSVDGRAVATADAGEWARGVPVDASPAHVDAEAYRALVNDKNEQFTFGWKALNQVHIVGERKSSPSGRALPAEQIAFKELARERDAKLRRGLPEKTRQWRLSRLDDTDE